GIRDRNVTGVQTCALPISQGNSTSGLGINKADVSYCIYDILVDDIEADKVCIETDLPNLHIIPATIQLAGAEIELVSTISREVRSEERRVGKECRTRCSTC